MNAIETVFLGIGGAVGQTLVSFPALWLSLLLVVPVWKISDWPRGPGKLLRNLGLLLIGLVFVGSAFGETWVTWTVLDLLNRAIGLRHLQALHAGIVVVAAVFAFLKSFFVGAAFSRTCAMADWLAHADSQCAVAGSAGSGARTTPALVPGMCGETAAPSK